jgi:alpha,alpha-trehalase
VGTLGEDRINLVVQTRQSRTFIAEAARTVAEVGGRPLPATGRVERDSARVAQRFEFELSEHQPLTLEKTVAVFTSRDGAVSEPGLAAAAAIEQLPPFDERLERHALAWDHLWSRFDLPLENQPEPQLILRLHIFHLLQTVSPNSIDLDVGVPARGLTGEAYRGHVFWDELFIFPLFNLRLPILTRSLLGYRYRRLEAARALARREGHRGAMFPWQSGSDGREESQSLHLNPKSGRWLPDNSRLQRHVSLAVAYNAWSYYQVTGDTDFLRFRGAPMILEVARLMASLATYDRAVDRYDIRGVMGPDEYHDGYPDRESPGLDNNAYTNVMTVWALDRALEILDVLPDHHAQELRDQVELTPKEVGRWDDMRHKLRVCFHDGVISQFEGYERLEELDWEAYRDRYGDIHRLDRILEAEGDTPNRYKLSKQADVLMIFYLLTAREVTEIFERLGYTFDPATDFRRNAYYYLARTSDGSTLSSVVHAWVMARLDRRRSWELFRHALRSDIHDVQGGTTHEGVHLGAMAGTVDLVQRCYAGLETHQDVLWLDPALPDELPSLHFRVHYRGHRVDIRIGEERVRVGVLPALAPPIRIGFDGEIAEFAGGSAREWPLRQR